MELTVKLEAFEGPLDLLLHLLDKNKVSIYDIPIAEITNQYLDYIKEMQRQDLNIMSEFLVMASALIAIKSRMLLPSQASEEGEEDPRAELMQQLLEYKLYKCMSCELRDLQAGAKWTLYKTPTMPAEILEYETPVDVDELLAGLTLNKLYSVFQSVLRRQENKIDKLRAGFGKIQKEDISLPDKMAYIEEYASSHKRFYFRHLLESKGSKMEIIVSFLAILEFIKMGRLAIFQENLFDDIVIESKIAAV